MALSRDQIMKPRVLKTREVHVPEWADGGDDVVNVRELTGEELDAFQASNFVRRPVTFGPNKGQMELVPDLGNQKAKLVSKAIVDEAGKRLFNDGDIVELGKLSAAALTRVYNAAAELSGLTDEDEAETSGNSDAAPSGSSTSELLETTAS
jgi:hypothetical protein